MNPEDFQSSAAGQVVPRTHNGLAYWAFVPDPLPPLLEIDWALAGLLVEATGAVHELAGLGRNLPNPQLFTRPLLRREAVLSSRIEGTQTEIGDLYAYEAGQLSLPGLESAPPEADLREVLNYVKALEYGLERAATLPVSLRLMRETHALLMHGVRGEQATPGEFRTGQNWIGQARSTLDRATFIPPPVEEMQTALSDLERYIHAETQYPPLVNLALIHYQFEVIHPFKDGNGRIGRLLIALLLTHWQLLPQPLLYLSPYFEKHRTEYVNRMLAVAQRGEWREWIEFFLTGVKEQSLDTVQRVRRLSDLLAGWRAKLLADKASPSMYQIMEGLAGKPFVSAADVSAQLSITHQAARTALRRLEKLGILSERTGKVRRQVYAAGEVLALL